MPILLALGLQLGLFTEVRVPADGYACLSVKYRHVVYRATRVERSRLTGRVTLTLPAPFDPVASLLGQRRTGRVVELGGYDVITDSTTCECVFPTALRGTCVDQ